MKALKFDPNIINDERCQRLSLMARFLFMKLVGLASKEGGYIAIRKKCISLEKAASSIGFNHPITDFVRELEAEGLLVEDECGWFIPELKSASSL